MKKRIVIFGGGVHCKCIIDTIEASEEFSIVGVIDSIRDIGAKIFDYQVIGKQNGLLKLMDENNIDGGVIALGDNYLRSIVEKEITSQVPNFKFFNVIHPSTILSKKANIGHGNVFMAGVIINTDATIHNHCIINTGSQLEHFSVMEDFSSLSAGVTTGGYVHLKQFSAVALGATVFDRVSIGYNAVIGSGSLVTKNIPDNVLAYGSPAKVIRKRELNDRFLK